MAKRRSGRTTRATAADRAHGSGRAKTGGNSKRGMSGRRGTSSGRGASDTMMGRGGGSERGREQGGMLAGARDVVGKVGRTTKDAAQSTMGAARDFAQGAAGVAGNVASRAGEMGSQVAGKVRENPWPTLLIGAGATWLAIDAIRGRSEDEDSHRGRGRRSSKSERGAVGQAMSKVADAGRSAGESIEEFVRDRPLLAGAATLGLGMAVGMAMPSSITENEMFGETRDRIVSRARDAARGTMDKVRDAAESLERIGPFGGGSSRGSSSSSRSGGPGRGSRG